MMILNQLLVPCQIFLKQPDYNALLNKNLPKKSPQTIEGGNIYLFLMGSAKMPFIYYAVWRVYAQGKS
jgi:hypothetical protein